MVQNQISNLQNLSNQITTLEGTITAIAGKLNKFSLDKEAIPGSSSQKTGIVEFVRPEFKSTAGYPSNIIPFPNSFRSKVSAIPGYSGFASGTSSPQVLEPILAEPGKSMPAEIPDFRPVLQRNGLILLAWDKRKTENGERYSAYWVTSAGAPRFYASKSCSIQDFPDASPDHKSYAAEDGIEFFGQEAPAYIVHVAPELMMSNPRHRELRVEHVKTLKYLGSMINFNYKYLLSAERNRRFTAEGTNGKKSSQSGA
jgi:hypothetical protein